MNDSRRVRAASETQYGFVGEMIRGHRDIKLLHCEESFLGRLNQSITNTLDQILQMRVKSMRFILIRTQFGGWSDFLFMLLLAALLVQGTLEPAKLLVLFNYNSNMSGGCARSVSDIMNTLYQLSLSTERIYQMMNSSDFAKESFGEVSLPRVSGELEFKDVGFSYSHEGEQVNVLSHLDLKIHAGESVAFVGRSGCGKSTILSLMTRLYDPQEGEILFDGIPLKDLSQDTLRGNMTMVSQSPYIFNMSVRDNLRAVCSDLTDDEMFRVCRIACIHDDVMAFPQGYDTVVGEGGVTLSGGQKQRLALARSILRNRPVLLLDEATSALDNETQAKIHEAISSLRGKNTLIMVAHRLSTVINCDRLFLIQNGRVAAEGSHEQLLQNCEDYRRLYTSEMGKEEIA
jgi:ABC-type multidrug transport system fused ATPase/permease subunit